MQVSEEQIHALSDEDLALIATAVDDTYPDEIVLAVWEQLAARGLVVDFVEYQPLASETGSDDLVTIATFRNYVQGSLPRPVCWRVVCGHSCSTTTQFVWTGFGPRRSALSNYVCPHARCGGGLGDSEAQWRQLGLSLL